MELLDLASNINQNPQFSSEEINLHLAGGLRLHMHGWLPNFAPDKVVVIVHGLGGHGKYYASSAAPYLAPHGAAVYAPDLRGHGRSEGLRGDIELFHSFLDDVAAAIRWARLKHPELPLFLLAESMGTSIAINYVVQAQPELAPDGLILVACVIAPTVTPSVKEVFRTFWYLATDRHRPALPITGREELGVRDTAFVQVLKADPLFNRKISVRFLTGMTRHMQQAARRPHALKLPILLLQGGHDYTVRHKPTRAFFNRIASADKEMHVFPQAYHAILNDPDAPQVRERLLTWLERQTKKFQVPGL